MWIPSSEQVFFLQFYLILFFPHYPIHASSTSTHHPSSPQSPHCSQTKLLTSLFCHMKTALPEGGPKS